MFFRYLLVCKIILVIAGAWWCIEIFRRRHRDFEDFRQRDDLVARRVVIGYWFATAVLLVLLLPFGFGVAIEFIDLFRGLIDFFRW
jgi:hypothetical protein